MLFLAVRSILIKTGPAGYTPDKMLVVRRPDGQVILDLADSSLPRTQFANQLLDFDEATSQDVTQSFDVAVTKEVIEYAVRCAPFPSLSPSPRGRALAHAAPPRRPAKFPSVRSLTLFFPSNHGEDTTRVSFVGFKGEYSALTVRLPSALSSLLSRGEAALADELHPRSATRSSPSTRRRPTRPTTPRSPGSTRRRTAASARLAPSSPSPFSLCLCAPELSVAQYTMHCNTSLSLY